MSYLVFPTVAVRESFLAGERADSGADTAWLDEVEADFDALVLRRRAVTQRWDVPVTELWYVDGADYLGAVVIRRRLTPALERVGGHIGYHVVPPHRRRGHATRMLADALVFCAHFGLTRLLLTCEETNVASRRVIETNGGEYTETVGTERHYRLLVNSSSSASRMPD